MPPGGRGSPHEEARGTAQGAREVEGRSDSRLPVVAVQDADVAKFRPQAHHAADMFHITADSRHIYMAVNSSRLNRHPALPEVEMITPIQAHAMAMFKDAIDAFVREDVDLGRAVVARDKDLDYMNKMANRQLTERMAQDPKQLRGYLNLIFISRCLERIGDHATNIAEDAVYAAAAEDIRHQPASAAG